MRQILIFVAAAVLIAGSTAAEQQDIFSPARIDGSGAGRLKTLVVHPGESLDEDVTIYCFALITASGRIARQACDPVPPEQMPFMRAVFNLVGKSVASAATMGGQPVGAWLQYRVQFSASGNNQIVSVYPNHGQMADAFGDTYYAPQRLFVTAGIDCENSDKTWVSMTIDSLGDASDVKVINESLGEGCRAAIARYFLQSLYVPARASGKYVDIYHETRLITPE